MKSTILAISVGLAGLSQAATLVDTNYSIDSTYSDSTGFVQSGVTTWVIDPGVTVTASTGRFFIGEQSAPSDSDAVFAVGGGGTLLITNSNAFTFRLGQNESFEAGVLRIQGGTLVEFSGNQGPWSQESNGVSYGDTTSRSRIELSGLGSTLIAEGTYDPLTALYNRGTTASDALPVFVSGGSLSATYDPATNVTTLTVVPEPSVALIGGLGLLGLLRRRRA